MNKFPSNAFSTNFKQYAEDRMLNSNIVDDLSDIAKAATVMSLYRMSDEGKNAPVDKSGAFFLFLHSFISTTEAAHNFVAVTKEFLKTRADKLKEYDNESNRKYVLPTSKEYPTHRFVDESLRLMLNGAFSGDDYCIKLIIGMYKTHHKKEYNSIKKYSVITGENILDVVSTFFNDDGDDNISSIVARILIMSELFGKKIDSSCFWLYDVLLKVFDGSIDISEEFLVEDVADEIMEEALELFDKYMKNPNRCKKNIKRLDKIHKAMEFVFHHDNLTGFIVDNVYKADDPDYLMDAFYSALVTLKATYPDETFTEAEICYYTYMTMLETSISNLIGNDNAFLDILVNKYDGCKNKGMFFDPLSVVDDDKKNTPVLETHIQVLPEEEEDKTKELEETIEDLKRKLNNLESEVSDLRLKNKSLKEDIKDSKAALEESKFEHEELIELRNFAYNSTRDDIETDDDNIDEMRNYISDKRIVVVGGHVNWLSKIKELFPKWTIIDVSNGIATVPDSIFKKADRVCVFTGYIGHKHYFKCISAIRKAKTPVTYLSDTNIDSTIKSIYRDAHNQKEEFES